MATMIKDIESLKNEKVLEKSRNAVFLFLCEPCLQAGLSEWALCINSVHSSNNLNV